MFLRREQQLRKKDLQLQENLCQFNKFLKDKSDKRQQYLKKAEDERRQKHAKEKELDVRRLELKRITQTCAELESEFQTHSKYERYLESVKKFDDTEIEFTLKRYEVLNDARLNLEKKEKTSSIELERLRKRLHDFTKEQNTKYLDLNNEKQRLQRSLEEVGNHAQELQAEVARAHQEKANRTRVLSETFMAVHNLYERCKGFLRGVHHFQDMQLAQEKKPAHKEQPEGADDQPNPNEEAAVAEQNEKVENQRVDMQLSIIGRYVVDMVHLKNEQ